jgi:hypothetical protein
MILRVSQMFMTQGLQDALIYYLQLAAAAINAGLDNDDDRRLRLGVGYLHGFILKVQRAGPLNILPADASELIEKANIAINYAILTTDLQFRNPPSISKKVTTRITE